MNKLFDIMIYDCVTTIVVVAASVVRLHICRCHWEKSRLAALY